MHNLIGHIHHGRVQVSYVPNWVRTGLTMDPCPQGPKWAHKNVVLNQVGHLLQEHPRSSAVVEPTHVSHQSSELAPLLDQAPSLQ